MQSQIKRLRLNQVYNVRDLGGFETNSNRIMRWNHLYRAGDLSQADETDWERLKSAGVRTILDLRSMSEITSHPDNVPEMIRWYHMPLQTEQIDMDNLSESASKAFEKSLKEGYLTMADKHIDLLAAALKKMTECLKDGAVLFHCSAGKDRTGVLASAVLYLCGVDAEDIEADYQISFTYNKRGINRLAVQLPGYERILPMLSSDKETMEALLKYYDETDLSLRLHENGFSKEEQSRLVFLATDNIEF